VAVNPGDPIRKGQKLLSIEAMKMETTLYAERPGRVAEVLAVVGRQVATGELLIKLTNT
jgi:pyruvate carboxylase